MKKALFCRVVIMLILAVAFLAGTAEARRPCPPGYHLEGPRGCMPNRPVPPPPHRYRRPHCPPGTIWRDGRCRRYRRPHCPPGTYWRDGRCRRYHHRHPRSYY